jgi:hypothetical protein
MTTLNILLQVMSHFAQLRHLELSPIDMYALILAVKLGNEEDKRIAFLATTSL